MKASYKMRKAVERLEKQFGELEKQFGVELHQDNRRGAGFYDFVELSFPGWFRGKPVAIVAHDGTIWIY